MYRIFDCSCFGALLHGEIELGWRGIGLMVLGLLAMVMLFHYSLYGPSRRSLYS